MTSSITVTYFDTAMALIEVGPFRLLTDPVLDPAGAHFDYGPVQLTKTGSSAATETTLGRIDTVLLSHDQHGDNLDAAGRALLAKVPLVLTTPLAASRLNGIRAEGLEPWERRLLRTSDGGELKVTAVPAQHGPDGTEEATGPVTGFILEGQGLAKPIYISGDTIRFAGTDEIVRRFAPIGLALLNIGQARVPALGEASLSLSAEEASQLARALRAEWIVPLHYEGWRHFTEGRSSALESFARQDIASRVRWLAAGQPTSFAV